METIGVIGIVLGFYRDHLGIMENNMETTIMGYIEFLRK